MGPARCSGAPTGPPRSDGAGACGAWRPRATGRGRVGEYAPGGSPHTPHLRGAAACNSSRVRRTEPEAARQFQGGLGGPARWCPRTERTAPGMSRGGLASPKETDMHRYDHIGITLLTLAAALVVSPEEARAEPPISGQVCALGTAGVGQTATLICKDVVSGATTQSVTLGATVSGAGGIGGSLSRRGDVVLVANQAGGATLLRARRRTAGLARGPGHRGRRLAVGDPGRARRLRAHRHPAPVLPDGADQVHQQPRAPHGRWLGGPGHAGGPQRLRLGEERLARAFRPRRRRQHRRRRRARGRPSRGGHRRHHGRRRPGGGARRTPGLQLRTGGRARGVRGQRGPAGPDQGGGRLLDQQRRRGGLRQQSRTA